MRIAYLGNYKPQYSTETHVAKSMESLGHTVVRLQEGTVRALDVPEASADCDVFWWTQTYGLAEEGGTLRERHQMLERLRALGIPSVGFHLDRWWGLERQDQLEREAFFRVDHLFTADGDPKHQQAFEALGINHHWLPPAVYHDECRDGRPRGQFRIPVAFVGSWRSYGHPAWWPQREALLDHLRAWYPRSFRCFPQGKAIRGFLLNDLYASAKVVIGDSCLAPNIDGAPIARYGSDRITESIGRGGFLLHPRVKGLTDGTVVQEGEHLACWDLGDWNGLQGLVDHYLRAEDERLKIRQQGTAHVRRFHTYAVRVQQVLSYLAEQGVLDQRVLEPGKRSGLVPNPLPALVQDGEPTQDPAGAVG